MMYKKLLLTVSCILHPNYDYLLEFIFISIVLICICLFFVLQESSALSIVSFNGNTQETF